MIVVWVLLAVAFLAAEAAISTAFFAFFLAVGFVAGAIAAVAGADPWLQALAAGVVALAGLAVGRTTLVRRFGGLAPTMEGVGDLVGQRAITVDEVGDEHHPGHALFGGERWLAVSESSTPLPPQTPVTIAAVRGTTLIVRPASA